MKATERKNLINILISDENLTTAHLKTMLYFINNEKNITSSDITKILKCKIQYTSKIMNELKTYGYIKVSGKIKSTRILLYEIRKEKCHYKIQKKKCEEVPEQLEFDFKEEE